MRTDTASPRGFTLLETLIWGAILLVIATIGFPALQKQISTSRLIASCEQIGVHARFARAEAVKLGLPVVFAPSYASSTLSAFADGDDSLTFDDGEELVFEIPIGGGAGQRVLFFMGPDLVEGTSAAPAQSVDGLTLLGGGTNVRGAVFQADGSIRDSGAFRLADGKSPRGNICEVRMAPAATARVALLKYVYDGPVGDGFYVRGSRSWEWY